MIPNEIHRLSEKQIYKYLNSHKLVLGNTEF
jgi:hypothetical protein